MERSDAKNQTLRKSPSPRWKDFERLIAAIHQYLDPDGEVRWNDAINGRQFDVTIRFRRGFYDYLVVIECKDLSRSVPVGDVEAFVTKSRDAHAQQAIVASASGFQDGAEQVARRHNIILINVTDGEINLAQFQAQWAGTKEVFHITNVELQYEDGHPIPLREESNAMEYYMKQITLQRGEERTTLNEFVMARSLPFGREVKQLIFQCPPGTRVVAPLKEEILLANVKAIIVTAGIAEAQIIKATRNLDPYVYSKTVRMDNVITGETRSFSRTELPLGLTDGFEVGAFYVQPALGNWYYYCDQIEDSIAYIYLVESFQHGVLNQALVKLDIKNGRYYVRVHDEATIERLRRRLALLKM